MDQPIVVGVTDRPAAARAVDWAGARSLDLGNPVVLTSVVGGAIGAVGEQEFVDAAVLAAQALVDGHADRLRERGVRVSTVVAVGDPVARLTEASENAAMLVIGSDYRGPDSGVSHGVHGTRIAAGALCPVVVVPDIGIDGRTGVVVGIDGSSASDAAIVFAAREALRLGEPLIAVGVWTPLETSHTPAPRRDPYLKNMQKMTEGLLFLALADLRRRHPDLRIELRAQPGLPGAVINDIARNARLAVLGSRGRGAIARFLLGSVAEEVLGRLATVTAVVR